MNVAWVHSFPDDIPNSGIFMFEMADAVRKSCVSLSLIRINPRDFKTFVKIPGEIKAAAGNSNLVHAQYGSGCGLAVANLPSPKVISLRGSDWHGCSAGTFRDLLWGSVSRRCTRAALQNYEKVIAVSERMKREILAWNSNLSVEVLPGGVDLDRFRQIDREEARAQLGCDGDRSPWVLFSTVQSNNSVKRERLAEEAFNLLRSRLPSAQFKVMTGLPRSEVPLMINASNVILLTSTHEGWPNIIKEGLACNVPFVSTDVSDLSTVAAAEECCRVVKDDPVLLARALQDVIDKPRPECLRRHAEPMEMRKTVQKLIEIYSTIV